MPDMPAPLDWLLQRLSRLVQTATDALETQYPGGVAAWEQEIGRQLARYHAAAMLVGSGAQTLTPAMKTAVTRDLATQLHFLRKFGITIKDGAAWERSWNSRAQMYAESIKIPFNRGITKMLPLPSMPCEGTTCLTRCGCFWEIDELEGDGNADAYWRRGKDDSCQVCVQRERDWSPVKVRDGVLQI